MAAADDKALLATAYRSWLDLLQASATPERIIAVVNKAWEQAAAGDNKARDWLSRYLLPQQVMLASNPAHADITLQFVQAAASQGAPPPPKPGGT
jgi:hypothetical protein